MVSLNHSLRMLRIVRLLPIYIILCGGAALLLALFAHSVLAHIAHNAARAAARGDFHDERGPFLNAGLPYLRPEAEGGGLSLIHISEPTSPY